MRSRGGWGDVVVCRRFMSAGWRGIRDKRSKARVGELAARPTGWKVLPACDWAPACGSVCDAQAGRLCGHAPRRKSRWRTKGDSGVRRTAVSRLPCRSDPWMGAPQRRSRTARHVSAREAFGRGGFEGGMCGVCTRANKDEVSQQPTTNSQLASRQCNQKPLVEQLRRTRWREKRKSARIFCQHVRDSAVAIAALFACGGRCWEKKRAAHQSRQRRAIN